jgi:GNAT superfamily N-acetyltransferase
MEFRTATPRDAELILQFWRDSGASVGTTDQVEQLRRVVANPAAVLLLAVAEGQIIGTLLGAFDGWRGNMYRLVVHPSRRRQGIARQLVRQVERVFAGWGVRRVTVLIEVDRPWAMEFWTAVGYPRDDHIVRHVRTLDE